MPRERTPRADAGDGSARSSRILHVDIAGVAGVGVSLRQRGGVVRDCRMDVVGRVVRTELVGRNSIRATVEVG